MAASLVESYPAIRRHMIKAIIDNPFFPSDLPEKQMQTLILEPLAAAHERAPRQHPIIIVLDALDECPTAERQVVLDKMTKLAVVPKLKIFTTSRSDTIMPLSADIASRMPEHERDEFDGDEEDTQVYVLDRLKDLDSAYTENEDLESLKGGREKLARMAGPLFIWAQLACSSVLESVDPLQHLKKLVKNPEERLSLDDLYRNIFERVLTSDSTTIDIAHSIIQAVFVAQSTLSITALSGLLEISEKAVDKTLDRLASVVQKDVENDPVLVRFVHPTTLRDFLQDGKACPEKFRIDPKAAHRILALASFKLMEKGLRPNLLQLEEERVLNSEIPDLAARLRLHVGEELRYAAVAWPVHAAQIIAEDKEVQEELKDLFEKRSLCWIELLSLLERVSAAVTNLEVLSTACHSSVSKICLFVDAVTDYPVAGPRLTRQMVYRNHPIRSILLRHHHSRSSRSPLLSPAFQPSQLPHPIPLPSPAICIRSSHPAWSR